MSAAAGRYLYFIDFDVLAAADARSCITSRRRRHTQLSYAASASLSARARLIAQCTCSVLAMKPMDFNSTSSSSPDAAPFSRHGYATRPGVTCRRHGYCTAQRHAARASPTHFRPDTFSQPCDDALLHLSPHYSASPDKISRESHSTPALHCCCAALLRRGDFKRRDVRYRLLHFPQYSIFFSLSRLACLPRRLRHLILSSFFPCIYA